MDCLYNRDDWTFSFKDEEGEKRLQFWLQFVQSIDLKILSLNVFVLFLVIEPIVQERNRMEKFGSIWYRSS